MGDFHTNLIANRGALVKGKVYFLIYKSKSNDKTLKFLSCDVKLPITWC